MKKNRETDHAKKRMFRWLGMVCAVSYFGVMLFLTFFAETIHERSLTKVQVSFAEIQKEQGQDYWAVPKEAYQDGSVFILQEKVKNAIERTIVKIVPVEIAKETKTGYLVTAELQMWDKLVVWSSRKLQDEEEVSVVKTREDI